MGYVYGRRLKVFFAGVVVVVVAVTVTGVLVGVILCLCFSANLLASSDSSLLIPVGDNGIDDFLDCIDWLNFLFASNPAKGSPATTPWKAEPPIKLSRFFKVDSLF